VAITLLLMLVIVGAVGRHGRRMLLGTGPRDVLVSRAPVLPMVAGLGACAVLGVTLGPLAPLLRAAAAIAGATP
jgi:hydrogenase-4 component F